MKKLILASLVVAQVLLADYRILVSTTDTYNESEVVKKEEIFFGEYHEYQSYLNEISLKVAEGTLNGLSNGANALANGFFREGLKGAGAGAGIGLVFGGIQYMIDKSKADQQYFLLEKISLANGNVELKGFLFSGNKNPVYSKEEVRNYIGEKQ